MFLRFSGLSLVPNKEVCDWQRQTLNLSELKGERPAKPDLIHTSCRSESSNISLVVLDKDIEVWILTWATFPNYVIPSGKWFTVISPLNWHFNSFIKCPLILSRSKFFKLDFPELFKRVNNLSLLSHIDTKHLDILRRNCELLLSRYKESPGSGKVQTGITNIYRKLFYNQIDGIGKDFITH